LREKMLVGVAMVFVFVFASVAFLFWLSLMDVKSVRLAYFCVVWFTLSGEFGRARAAKA
jgi:hypothetical protein